MLDTFRIDLTDIGADGADLLRYWNHGDSPTEFVSWFGEKYDLVRRDDWNPLAAAKRRASSPLPK